MFKGRDRRKYQRYNMETKIHFYVDYELVTKVKFKLMCASKSGPAAEKFSGITKNISAEGLRFSSGKKLKKGDKLCLEVFLPKGRKPIPMVAEVKWSRKLPSGTGKKFRFDTGVKVLAVKGRSVAKTIRIDHKYKEPWSIVLSSVLGGFHKTLHKVMASVGFKSPEAILKKII